MDKRNELRLYAGDAVRRRGLAGGVSDRQNHPAAAVPALGGRGVNKRRGPVRTVGETNNLVSDSVTIDANQAETVNTSTNNTHVTGNGNVRRVWEYGVNRGIVRNKADGPSCKTEPIEIIQINLQKAKSATAVLQQTLIEIAGPKIALCQEPWTYKDKVCGMGSTDCVVHADSSLGRPRAAIICSKNLNAVCLPQFCSRDLVAVQLNIVRKKINGGKMKAILASAYLPYEQNDIPSQELVELVNFCKRESIPLLVGLDANAHHVVWGSSDTNRRGRRLLEYLGINNLEILNQGNTPTFVIARRQEVIDITCSTVSMQQYIQNWRVSDEDSMSDHRHIRFEILSQKIERKLYRNPKKTNWTVFNDRLEGRLEQQATDITNTEMLDEVTDRIERAVTKSYHDACPIRKQRVKTSAPWWSGDNKQELGHFRTMCRRSMRKALYTKDDRHWQEHKQNRANYQRAIRRSKRKSWRLFCQEISQVPEMARLTKILKGAPTATVGMLEKEDGHMTTTESEAAEVLLQEHFPKCIIGETSSHLGPMVEGQPDAMRWGMASKIFTESRIRFAVKQLSAYKAPGVDDIQPILLKKGIERLWPHLREIYRTSLAFGYIPKSWRRSRIVFLAKPGKDNYKNAKSFRPISLSSFVLKTMEKVIDRYMKEHWLLRCPLSERQHAYMTGRSTETALHCVVDRIETTLEHKQYAMACLVDISGAFNYCRHQDVSKSLKKHGLPPVLVDWAIALLSQRDVMASVGSNTTIARTKCGTAQGGVMSATFWILVINSLIEELNHEHLWAQGYSDDVIVVLKGIDLGTLCSKMESALKLINDWCGEHGLSVNPRKTEAIVFTRNRKMNGLRPLKLKGVEINYSQSVKYLGVHLDPKLTWMCHIERKCNQAMKMFWLIRGAVGKTWGISPKTATWIYKVVFRPAITHGAIGWWKGTEKEKAKTMLSRVQRLACICITGAMRTTPTAAMEVLLGFSPIGSTY